MTAVQNQPASQLAHLSAEDVELLGKELDAIRQGVLDSRGASDAAYIRRVIRTQRGLELGSRAVLLFSIFPPAWLLGTAGLSLAKILENMEIGHNVMHGQWDWMRDPKIHSTTWEWDHVSPSEQWKHAHNELHHTYTNIIGKDNDLGYGIMRVDEDMPWEPAHLLQTPLNFFNMLAFEYGIATFDLNSLTAEERKVQGPKTLAKLRRQITKDFVVHPLLSLPTGSFLPTLAANVVANLVRNVWSHSVIMCGHFPEGVEVFEHEELDVNETRGEWYLRQMLGSANISGSPLLHILTGNLSHQIEHHLFPDLPSNRYAEIAPKVRELFEKNGLTYNARPLVPQVYSAWHRVVRLSLPNGWLAETTPRTLPKQLRTLWRAARAA